MSRPPLLRALAAAALAAVLALTTFARPATSLPAPAETSSHIGLYALDWNTATKNRTAANWELAARTHDLLVGNNAYWSHIGQLKSANPNLTVCVYDLGPYTVKGTPLYDQLMGEHPEYFARDANGNLITVKAASGTPAFPNNTLMDQGNPGWHRVMAQRIVDAIAAPTPDFDCAYTDSMGPGPFSGSTSGKPIKPGTSPPRPYTQTEWFQAARDELAAIKSAIGPGKYLFSTGIVNGPSYKANTHWMADSNADGFMTDSFMRLANAPATGWPTFSVFQGNLDMINDLDTKGKAFFGWVKLWNSNFTANDQKRWNDFTLAAYLLVKQSRQYFTLNFSLAADRTTVEFENQRADLGAALGPYTRTSACGLRPPTSACVYTREFQRGKVTVNPVTHDASITVTAP